jgi:mono/diheme cytochrome c family protein
MQKVCGWQFVTPHVGLACAVGLAALADLSSAEALGSVQDGHAMAQRLCARCHAISGPGPSPVAQAPPFSTFERNWPVEYLAEALAEGIVTGHGPVQMPVFVFTPDEIDDLLAYLESVQEQRP